MSDFWKETKVKRTRRNRRCGWCATLILKGGPSVVVAGVSEGDFFKNRYHPECCEAIPRWYTANNCWGEEMPEEPMERGGIRWADELVTDDPPYTAPPPPTPESPH